MNQLLLIDTEYFYSAYNSFVQNIPTVNGLVYLLLAAPVILCFCMPDNRGFMNLICCVGSICLAGVCFVLELVAFLIFQNHTWEIIFQSYVGFYLCIAALYIVLIPFSALSCYLVQERKKEKQREIKEREDAIRQKRWDAISNEFDVCPCCGGSISYRVIGFDGKSQCHRLSEYDLQGYRCTPYTVWGYRSLLRAGGYCMKCGFNYTQFSYSYDKYDDGASYVVVLSALKWDDSTESLLPFYLSGAYKEHIENRLKYAL